MEFRGRVLHTLIGRYVHRSNMETFLASILGSVSTLTILGIVGFLCKNWLLERLKASIKHEYDLKLAEVEHQREMRLKGEVVAELLAQWLRAEKELDYYQLNKLAFQAFVWLPEDLAKDLSESLAHKVGSDDVRALVKKVRSHLQGSVDGFEQSKVIVFQDPKART
ncbi:hypothetical protein [Vibrio vulnificus]|uniref:hypothetical protein n=1 Tax=Vibrio vulnificus TaxID=672 RepID=UPI00287BA792|nr:hypothetical protein [Vibrio vulnificus]